MLNNQSITLASPLPWFTPSGKSGVVTEIFTDRVHLKVSHADQRINSLEEISICLIPSNFRFQITGRVTDGLAPDTQVLAVDSKNALTELLGQVRKDQHIEICRNLDVESKDKFTGFENLNFLTNALSELDENELDTSRQFLGTTFSAPLLITGMTGGIDKGAEINLNLAKAARHFQIPMGVGSQRIALENSRYADIFRVKQHVSGLFLIGNIGWAQLKSADALDLSLRAIDMIEADALAIHLNILQESIQVEGDRNFSSLLSTLEQICLKSSVPIIVKEVGCGLDPKSIKKLVNAGVSAVDVGGSGGTSWGYIEGLRSDSSQTRSLGETFRNWGIPTAYALSAAVSACPDLPCVATGGIRDGQMIAKACGLSAAMVGIGLPLLRAALHSEQAVIDALDTYIRGLKIVMMATGSKNIDELKNHLILGRPLEAEFFQKMQSPMARPYGDNN